MKRTGVVLGVIGAVVAASGACTSSGTSGSSSGSDGGGDGGGCSTCTVSDGGPVDSGSPGDSASSGDAADAAPACNLHLPSGFSLAVADPGAATVETGAPGNRSAAMVLDENDDPMFAWASYPGGSSVTVTIYFARWDACAGAFTTPVVVDTEHTGARPDVALGYDPSTHEVDVAYVKSVTDDNWASFFSGLWLGSMKAAATTFTLQEVGAPAVNYTYAGGPEIAMAGGHVYVAYWEGPYPDNTNNGNSSLAWLLSSTDAPGQPPLDGPNAAPDGSVGDASPAPEDAGAEDSGAGPQSHYFTYEAVPYAGGVSSPFTGFVAVPNNSNTISLAIDSDGVPAVALYQYDDDTLTYDALFWRANTGGAVLVHSFTLDSAPDISLAFEGTKPRIAGDMDVPAVTDGGNAADSIKFFASDDGVSWSSGVNLPSNDGSQQSGPPTVLALDGMGNAAVVADIGGGIANGMACGASPYVGTSSDEDDGGALWTVCGADTTDVYAFTVSAPSAAYGSSRLKGKLTASFVTGAGTEEDGGAYPAGIFYWQHP